jgi:dsRNA-specific ribonuclease
VHDDGRWFDDLFITGPGFQMAQIFIENVFEKHVDWINLIRNDDNYKNILQVKIQKEFKVTPDYMEIEEHNVEHGYKMGVYLCLGQPVHNMKPEQATPIDRFQSYIDMHQYMSTHNKMFVFLAEGKHKIKKKAEQMACEEAIRRLNVIEKQ